jgi:hypothetical protein
MVQAGDRNNHDMFGMQDQLQLAVESKPNYIVDDNQRYWVGGRPPDMFEDAIIGHYSPGADISIEISEAFRCPIYRTFSMGSIETRVIIWCD